MADALDVDRQVAGKPAITDRVKASHCSAGLLLKAARYRAALSNRPPPQYFFSLQDDFELCLQFVLHFYCTAG